MWGTVSASEKNCKVGYRLVSVGVWVRMVYELLQTISNNICSLVCRRCGINKQPDADCGGNLLESRGTGAESAPIGCEAFMKASKVQGSSLLLSNADHFVGYSYVYGPQNRSG